MTAITLSGDALATVQAYIEQQEEKESTAFGRTALRELQMAMSHASIMEPLRAPFERDLPHSVDPDAPNIDRGSIPLPTPAVWNHIVQLLSDLATGYQRSELDENVTWDALNKARRLADALSIPYHYPDDDDEDDEWDDEWDDEDEDEDE